MWRRVVGPRDFYCGDLEQFSSFSCYFKSGHGWYHGIFAPDESGVWQRVEVRKDSCGIEGQPDGWGKISCIRISGWRAGEKKTRCAIANVAMIGGEPDIAIVYAESQAADVAVKGDAFAQCKEACRKHGVKMHAWRVCWNMGGHTSKAFEERMKAAGRTQVDVEGNAYSRCLDFACHMDYVDWAALFRNQVRTQMTAVGKVRMYPGIGLSCWQNDGQDGIKLVWQIEVVRALGLDGFTVFNFDRRAERVLPLLRTGVTKEVSHMRSGGLPSR